MFDSGAVLNSLLILGIVSTVTPATDAYWCGIQEKYCEGLEHVGCEPNSFPNNLDSVVQVLPMSLRTQNLIVDMHNGLRDSVANGSVKGYPKAQKMKLLEWDADLAETAELMVAHGTYEHDQCRSTETSPDAGQNLGMTRNTNKAKVLRVRAVARSRIQSWFDEYMLEDPSIVDQFYPGTPAGHFTTMVRDDTAKIGCASAYINDPTQRIPHGNLICCNYQFTNIHGMPAYISGKPCQGGKICDTVYKSLCVN